jgi:hypothetical protein
MLYGAHKVKKDICIHAEPTFFHQLLKHSADLP